MADDEEEVNNTDSPSPFLRVKSKIRKKLDDLADDIQNEIKDDLNSPKSQIRKCENVANDLVGEITFVESVILFLIELNFLDPDTLDELKEMIMEKPEIQEGIDWKLWYHITTKTVTYVILKVVDIFTDFAAAYQHFKRSDVKYGALTLFFVYLPGFVISLGFTYWGLTAPRAAAEEGEEPRRKSLSCKRVWRYVGVLFIFPLLYPIIQVLLGLILVILLIRRRDREPLKFMGKL